MRSRGGESYILFRGSLLRSLRKFIHTLVCVYSHIRFSPPSHCQAACRLTIWPLCLLCWNIISEVFSGKITTRAMDWWADLILQRLVLPLLKGESNLGPLPCVSMGGSFHSRYLNPFTWALCQVSLWQDMYNTHHAVKLWFQVSELALSDQMSSPFWDPVLFVKWRGLTLQSQNVLPTLAFYLFLFHIRGPPLLALILILSDFVSLRVIKEKLEVRQAAKFNMRSMPVNYVLRLLTT